MLFTLQSRRPSRAAVRYAIAVAFVATALVGNFYLPLGGIDRHYFLFSVAILGAAILGGMGPGLLATGLSVLASSYFFLETLYSLRSYSERSIGRLILFVADGVLISALGSFARKGAPLKQIGTPAAQYMAAIVMVGVTTLLKLYLFPSISHESPF